MVKINTLNIDPPTVNSSCAWASDFQQLQELYDSPYTGAVITRTATLAGFTEDASNTVAFTSGETVTSLNSYGYSPFPLSNYLDWIFTLLTTPSLDGSPPTKPFVISITASTPTVLTEMITSIQGLRKKLRESYAALGNVSPPTPPRTSSAPTSPTTPAPPPLPFVPQFDPATLVAVELNTSCPNIRDAPPPSYTLPFLVPLLDVLAHAYYADPSLTVGLKLPPYLYGTRFTEVLRVIHTYTRELRAATFSSSSSHYHHTPTTPSATYSHNPFAYLASTNTLGNCLLFAEQTAPLRPFDSPDPDADPMDTDFPSHTLSSPPPLAAGGDAAFAVPPVLGGLGGEALHPVALGNVYTFARLLAAHRDPAMRRIRIIGIGGVTSAAAARRMRAAGAAVVGCATLLGREGVRAFEILAQDPEKDELGRRGWDTYA